MKQIRNESLKSHVNIRSQPCTRRRPPSRRSLFRSREGGLYNMKLWSSYLKEMTIAGRGFYFYIEIFIALVMLIVLLVVVNENPVSKEEEIVYYDMTPFMFKVMTNKEISDGQLRMGNEKSFTLKPGDFKVINDKSGEKEHYTFDEEKVIDVKTLETLDAKTGDLIKRVYVADNREDMIRLAHQEKSRGAVIRMKEGEFAYQYYLQGYETDRLVNLLYLMHNDKSAILQTQMNRQDVRELETHKTLNARENVIPLFITFAGSLMGFFIVMAYI